MFHCFTPGVALGLSVGLGVAVGFGVGVGFGVALGVAFWLRSAFEAMTVRATSSESRESDNARMVRRFPPGWRVTAKEKLPLASAVPTVSVIPPRMMMAALGNAWPETRIFGSEMSDSLRGSLTRNASCSGAVTLVGGGEASVPLSWLLMVVAPVTAWRARYIPKVMMSPTTSPMPTAKRISFFIYEGRVPIVAALYLGNTPSLF